MIRVEQPVADLVTDAIERIRPHLDRSLPLKQRVENFWAGARAARNRGAADVLTEEFTALAQQTGLTADLRWEGKEQIAHLISWALRNMNPFR
jgi:hypothetical protein